MITDELEQCLLNEKEIIQWKKGSFVQKDKWPIVNYQDNNNIT